MCAGYVSGEDGGDGTMPGSTVSVSLVGLAVYLSWGLLFLSLIAILFFLACTPCQRSVIEHSGWWMVVVHVTGLTKAKASRPLG